MNTVREEMEKGTVKGLIMGESILLATGVALGGVACLLAEAVEFTYAVYDVCRKRARDKSETTDSE